jgi:dienelactone hydrolase
VPGIDVRGIAKRSATITALYRWLQFRHSAQPPWEGVPPGYQNLPIGRLEIPSSLVEWEARRQAVRAILIRCLGQLPARPSPLSVRTVSTDQKDGYKIEKFVFHNDVDSEVPGYIAIPDSRNGQLPAVMAMHGHSSSAENLIGYKPNSQSVAEALVRRGYVVLAIDNYFSGARRGTGPAGSLEMQDGKADQEMSLTKLNLWLGRTLWGMMLRDQQMALDYLESRPEVDPTRIGAQGMSMGSTQACWLGAIDDRIKAVVGVACFTRYEDLIAVRQLGAHGIYYFVPGILSHFDSEGVLALLAPCPFLALTGDSDPGSPLEGMRTLERILSRFYALYGRSDAFRNVIYPRTGHVYNDHMKQAMLEWFDRFLRG